MNITLLDSNLFWSNFNAPAESYSGFEFHGVLEIVFTKAEFVQYSRMYFTIEKWHYCILKKEVKSFNRDQDMWVWSLCNFVLYPTSPVLLSLIFTTIHASLEWSKLLWSHRELINTTITFGCKDVHVVHYLPLCNCYVLVASMYFIKYDWCYHCYCLTQYSTLLQIWSCLWSERVLLEIAFLQLSVDLGNVLFAWIWRDGQKFGGIYSMSFCVMIVYVMDYMIWTIYWYIK